MPGLAAEALGMAAVCSGKDAGPAGLGWLRLCRGGCRSGVQAQARVPVLRVVPGEERLAVRPAASIELKRPGNPGRSSRSGMPTCAGTRTARSPCPPGVRGVRDGVLDRLASHDHHDPPGTSAIRVIACAVTVVTDEYPAFRLR